MPLMTKRVNIIAPLPVRNVTPTIHGNYNNIIVTTGDILKCLLKRATVNEILPDGSTVRLNMNNYYTDNGAGLDAVEKESKVEKVEEDVIKPNLKDTSNEVPEAPLEAQVVETNAPIEDNKASSNDNCSESVTTTTVQENTLPSETTNSNNKKTTSNNKKTTSTGKKKTTATTVVSDNTGTKTE